MEEEQQKQWTFSKADFSGFRWLADYVPRERSQKVAAVLEILQVFKENFCSMRMDSSEKLRELKHEFFDDLVCKQEV